MADRAHRLSHLVDDFDETLLAALPVVDGVVHRIKRLAELGGFSPRSSSHDGRWCRSYQGDQNLGQVLGHTNVNSICHVLAGLVSWYCDHLQVVPDVLTGIDV